MAGVKSRRLAGESVCSSDLCQAAAEIAPGEGRLGAGFRRCPDHGHPVARLSSALDGLPSAGQAGRLPITCAAFDVGLGCSGYPYGLYLGALMISHGGIRRALVLHGETPARFADESDRSVSLLFGDAGSATALEADPSGNASPWAFVLHTDGTGYEDPHHPGRGLPGAVPRQTAEGIASR
ncbi:MAG: hypothetical protein M0C28_27510 [Candidatus Moduliflexus flocculans]|nr:hypothetical protein [Candidatus Moduliflexus flocculans]